MCVLTSCMDRFGGLCREGEANKDIFTPLSSLPLNWSERTTLLTLPFSLALISLTCLFSL